MHICTFEGAPRAYSWMYRAVSICKMNTFRFLVQRCCCIDLLVSIFTSLNPFRTPLFLTLLALSAIAFSPSTQCVDHLLYVLETIQLS